MTKSGAMVTSPLLACCVDTPGGSNESIHQTLFRHIELDRDMYAVFKGHPHYERTAEFVALCDIPTFDPAAEAPSLSHFVPMLRRLIAAPKQWIYKAAMGPGAVRA